ncbi:MAG: hypothetical protein ACXVP0_15895 [Bacteroidia bacterium]
MLCLPFFSQQSPDKVKVKRNNASIFFFQTGRACDTLIPNQTDIFFFAVSDSMKCRVDILVENGQLMRTVIDSIYKLRPMKGMKYLHQKCDRYTTVVDGACEASNTVTIYVRKKSSASKTAEGEKILMTSKFIIR